MEQWTRLSNHVCVHHGAINVGIVQDGRRALLIDYGDGDVLETLRALGADRVDAVLFTHYHRDQASGARAASDAGARMGVPAEEVALFSDVERYWHDPAQRWHLYDFHPSNLLLGASIPVHDTYHHGDTFSWGPAAVMVLATPGHTDGSVSYLVTVQEEDRDTQFLFCGDLIYAEGQLWDLYSLQKGRQTRDYHGFMGDQERLVESLEMLRAIDADAMVPSHGTVITKIDTAIDLLCKRLDRCYEQYVAISALRHYFPALFVTYQGISGALPIGEGIPCPDFVHHLGTTWVVVSESRAAFAIDCGSEAVVKGIEDLQSQGALGRIEWLWISHYHDDHVNAVPALVERFACPVVADESVAQIVEHPLDWRLPCISPVRVSVDRHTFHGESWRWHEFTVTAYHLPGQTLYHGGLLVEGRGARILFAGDSFTMAGIDDYCMGNRNFLGQGVGFDACLALVQEIEPDLIVNCHVDLGFRFTSQACQLMRDNLAARERLYGELVPWDHANYGMDEHWIRCQPYEQRVAPGGRAHLRVVCTNHSDGERVVTCRPVLPEPWDLQICTGQAIIAPRTEGCVAFDLSVPYDTLPGRWVVPVEITYHERRLGQYREAIIVVTDQALPGGAVPCA